MRTINSFILLCVFCLFCQPILAQRRVRLADLPPFERAVVVVKYFEGDFKGVRQANCRETQQQTQKEKWTFKASRHD